MVREGLREGRNSHAKWTKLCTTFQAFCGLGAARDAVWTALFAVFWLCTEITWKHRQASQHWWRVKPWRLNKFSAEGWDLAELIFSSSDRVLEHDNFICAQKSECVSLSLLRSMGTSMKRVNFVKMRTVSFQTEGCSLWKVPEDFLFHCLLFLKVFFFFYSSMFPLK